MNSQYDEHILRLGLPKGSLNNPERGDTSSILKDAHYRVVGYQSGKEDMTRISIDDPEIKAFITTSQSAPLEVRTGIIDAAISGSDHYENSMCSSYTRRGIKDRVIVDIGDLEYGKTKIVPLISDDDPSSNLDEFLERTLTDKEKVMIFTEYVNLTSKMLMNNNFYNSRYGTEKPFCFTLNGRSGGSNMHVLIIETYGATESFVGPMGKGGDLAIDNYQTGTSAKKSRLKKIEITDGKDYIMESSVHLYLGIPKNIGSLGEEIIDCFRFKQEKCIDIYQNLYGVIQARRLLDVRFNVPSDNMKPLVEYLRDINIARDNPSVIPGEPTYQIDIVMLKQDYNNVKRTLIKDFGARAFIVSSIQQYVGPKKQKR